MSEEMHEGVAAGQDPLEPLRVFPGKAYVELVYFRGNSVKFVPYGAWRPYRAAA